MKTATATIQVSTSTPVSRIQFTARRPTFAGIEYTAEDGHVTTVNGTSSTCSCGMEKYSVICIHRLAALSQEKVYAEEAQQRSAYCTEFAIY